MPLAASANLDGLYAKQQLLEDETARLEQQRLQLPQGLCADDRQYILELEIRALAEEATKLNASISDILDRDLQR
jgi:hypothetical protein